MDPQRAELQSPVSILSNGSLVARALCHPCQTLLVPPAGASPRHTACWLGDGIRPPQGPPQRPPSGCGPGESLAGMCFWQVGADCAPYLKLEVWCVLCVCVSKGEGWLEHFSSQGWPMGQRLGGWGLGAGCACPGPCYITSLWLAGQASFLNRLCSLTWEYLSLAQPMRLLLTQSCTAGTGHRPASPPPAPQLAPPGCPGGSR